MSAKRRRELAQRKKVRAIVLERAGNRCEWAPLIPELACGWLPDRTVLEIDELRGGAYRCTEWLDPERCVATCPAHHDHKSAAKREMLARWSA